MRQIILTGDRPTGRLHVGHYVGSLKGRVTLQNSGKFDEIYIMIADAQALTDNAEHPEKVRSNILQVALDYLACGIDPEKSTIFIQSMIPQLTELTFYYMNLVHSLARPAQPDCQGGNTDAQLRSEHPRRLLLLPDKPGGGHHGIPRDRRPRRRGPGADARAVPRNRPQIQRRLRRDAHRAGNHAPRQPGLPAPPRHRRQGEDEQIAWQLHLPLRRARGDTPEGHVDVHRPAAHPRAGTRATSRTTPYSSTSTPSAAQSTSNSSCPSTRASTSSRRTTSAEASAT